MQNDIDGQGMDNGVMGDEDENRRSPMYPDHLLLLLHHLLLVSTIPSFSGSASAVALLSLYKPPGPAIWPSSDCLPALS